MRWKYRPYHGRIISQYDGVSVYRSQSQIATVRAIIITADSLLPRPKLDYDKGYDVAVEGPSVVVRCASLRSCIEKAQLK